MGGYGYRYESYSTYDTAGGGRIEEPFGSLIKKPFGPFVPDSSNRNSESYFPRRKQVPVTTGPYADGYRHSSPTKAYPARDDAYERHRQANPVRGRPEFLTNVQNEASRPAGFNPATTDWRQLPHTTANGYGDYGGSKEARNHKPIVRSDSYDDYHRDDGSGGNYSHKGHKPIARPIGNDIYDYNHDNSYGEEQSLGPRVFPKSKSPDGYDNSNRDNGYGGNNYGNKEGQKPIVRNEAYDGYNRDNGGYGGNYGNKEGHKPMGSPVRNESFDGYRPAGNNGDAKKPTAGGGWNRPIWTTPPKQGTQLTSPTSDINMAIELLKNLSGGPKTTANDYPNDKYDNFRGRNDGVDRPTTVAPPNSGYKQSEPSNNVGKAIEPPVKEPERIKNAVIAPLQPRTTVPMEPNKYDGDGLRRYVDSGTIDSKQAARKFNGRLL